MINNNDMVRVTSINHYVCEPYLSNNLLYNRYFNERMPLAYLFRWSYRQGVFRDTSFKAILFNGGQHDK